MPMYHKIVDRKSIEYLDLLGVKLPIEPKTKVDELDAGKRGFYSAL